MCQNSSSTAETLQSDPIGMTCVSHSPISKLNATIEYNWVLCLRRITIELENLSWNSGWTHIGIPLSVLELEAQTLSALERWQERHIKRALSGYKPWPFGRLARALQAELVVSYNGSTPWKRLFS